MDAGPLGLLRSSPLTFLLLIGGLLLAIALHEYGHALAADLQGDRLPRASGRLTLNPLRHLDPLGTLAIVLVGFGWGKPVEFRPQALSSERFGAALVALAGPFMNLLLALASGFVYANVPGLPDPVADFLGLFATLNVVLAVFNLLPLPPLDGSRLLTIFLPPGRQKIVFWLDRYGFLVLLFLLFFGLLGRIMDPLVGLVSDLLFGLVGL